MRIALFQHCRFSHITNLQLSPVTSFRFHAIFSKRGRRSLFPITNPYCVDPFSPTVTAKSHARFKRWRAGPHSLQILTRLGSRDSYAPWLGFECASARGFNSIGCQPPRHRCPFGCPYCPPPRTIFLCSAIQTRTKHTDSNALCRLRFI